MQRCAGIDLGYGFVKVTDGQDGYVFPSVVGDGGAGPILRTELRPPARVDDLRLAVDGQSYYVGHVAIRQSRLAYRSLSTTRVEGNDLRVLFLAGLSLFCQQPLNSLAVVTGLPPGRMHLAEELTRQVKGEHRVVLHRHQGDEEVIIRIDRLAVVPQPMGTYWSQVLDARGQLREDSPLLEGRTGIVDVGFLTSDLVTVEGGEYVPERSRTIPVGLATAFDEIAARLTAEHGVERQGYALDDAVIRGVVTVAGRQVDITDMRESAFRQLATKVMVELQSAWQVTEFDRLLVCGGGARALHQYLLPHLSQGAVPPDPLTSNSRGYLAWAQRLWNPAPAAWNETRTATA